MGEPLVKMDHDLVRSILLAVEDWPPNHRPQTITLEGWDQETIDRHIQLLEEDGLLIAGFLEVPEYGILKKAEVQRLTAAGHDHLQAVRDASVWTRVQGRLADVGGGATLDVVRQLAVSLMKTRLGLPE